MTHRTHIRILAFGFGAFLAAQPAAAQRDSQPNAFSWRGPIATGKWVAVRDINGAIRVERATGGDVEVTATKRWRRGDPKGVRIERYTQADGSVLICALWRDATCDARGYHSRDHGDNDDNDVAVDFTLRVPDGVRVDVSTVNGELRIAGVGAEVKAHTVNGEVEASTSMGPVDASTVNGGVHVRMSAVRGDDDLRYSTVNGSVIVELPPTIDAELEASTVNGSIQSDYPLTLSGRVDPRHIRATIGRGGRRLQLSTVNGGVELRKRS